MNAGLPPAPCYHGYERGRCPAAVIRQPLSLWLQLPRLGACIRSMRSLPPCPAAVTSSSLRDAPVPRLLFRNASKSKYFQIIGTQERGSSWKQA